MIGSVAPVVVRVRAQEAVSEPLREKAKEGARLRGLDHASFRTLEQAADFTSRLQGGAEFLGADRQMPTSVAPIRQARPTDVVRDLPFVWSIAGLQGIDAPQREW